MTKDNAYVYPVSDIYLDDSPFGILRRAGIEETVRELHCLDMFPEELVPDLFNKYAMLQERGCHADVDGKLILDDTQLHALASAAVASATDGISRVSNVFIKCGYPYVNASELAWLYLPGSVADMFTGHDLEVDAAGTLVSEMKRPDMSGTVRGMADAVHLFGREGRLGAWLDEMDKASPEQMAGCREDMRRNGIGYEAEENDMSYFDYLDSNLAPTHSDLNLLRAIRDELAFASVAKTVCGADADFYKDAVCDPDIHNLSDALYGVMSRMAFDDDSGRESATHGVPFGSPADVAAYMLDDPAKALGLTNRMLDAAMADAYDKGTCAKVSEHEAADTKDYHYDRLPDVGSDMESEPDGIGLG